MTAAIKPLVLNVDDQDPQRYVKTRDLQTAGFDVLEAINGAQALLVVEHKRPPVVLLDVQLPDISGFEVCRFIKKKWPDTMVLMTSATFVTANDRTLGLDSGADSYLVQPSEPLELAAAINALMRIARSEGELRQLNQALGKTVVERSVALSEAVGALKLSADRLRLLFETTFIYQWLLSPDGTVLDANRASLNGIGGGVEQVIGLPFWESGWFSGTPGMAELVRGAIGAVSKSEVHHSIQMNLPTGQRDFDISFRAVRDQMGKVTCIMPEAVDTTQRLKAEQALRQSQKMEAIGRLTGGLAHDFNNLLTAVVGNLDLIRRRATDQRMEQLANNALAAAERGSKLTSQLLAFSRTQKLATAPIAVNTLISGMRELLVQALGVNITTNFVAAADLPNAMADANQLELAVLNLAINARDAMPEGGGLTIATSLASDDTIRISITDTGQGMSPDVLSRAFDPFFTTKPVGKGTGLGLSQVYGMIRQIGGDVTIESKPGQGTNVVLHLPRATSEITEPSTDALRGIRPEPYQKILVVDDDADVREIVSGYLAEIGYEVRVSKDGAAALVQLREFAPDLMVLDFAMPGMNGAELAAAVRHDHPVLPVLFVSGYADTSALESAVGNAPLLHKPFRLVELAAAVRAVLEG